MRRLFYLGARARHPHRLLQPGRMVARQHCLKRPRMLIQRLVRSRLARMLR